MESIDVDIRSCPIKIGYSVSLKNEKELQKAMQTASTYWAGFQHCLIPKFDETEDVRLWNIKHSRKLTGVELTQEFISTFSPDYLCHFKKNNNIHEGKLGTADIHNLLRGTPYPKVEHGLALLESINGDIEELYSKNVTEKFTIAVSDGSSPVLDAFLMRPRQGMHKALKADLNKTDFFKVTELGPTQLLSHYAQNEFTSTLTDFSRYKLKENESRTKKIAFLLCDSQSFSDAFHLWNFRAYGQRIFPLFLDCLNKDDVSELCKLVAKFEPRKSLSPYELPKMFISGDLKKKDAVIFLNEITKQVKEPILSITWGIPRYWHRKENSERRNTPSNYFFSSTSKNLFINNGFIKIPLKLPKFFQDDNYSNTAICKTVCALNHYNNLELASVFPNITIQGYPELFFSENRLLITKKYSDTETIVLSTSDDIAKAFFKQHGVECNISQPGKYFTKMVNSIGGVYPSNPLLVNGMLDFLYKIKKPLSAKGTVGGITALLNKSKNRRGVDAKEIVKILVDQKILKMLIQLACPNCNSKFEVSLGELEEEMRCKTCFEKFDDHSSDSSRMSFVYKRSGVFALPNKSYGVPVAYLTLAFFQRSGFSNEINWGTSYEISMDGKSNEIDLVTFAYSNTFYDERVRPVFAECKFFSDFEKNDTDLFYQLGEKFPESILVFATMKVDLSTKEKKLLISLAKKIRRNFKKTGKGSNLLILTSNELEVIGINSKVWGKEYKNDSMDDREKLGHFDLDCFISQEKYLDLKLNEMRILTEPIAVSSVI